MKDRPEPTVIPDHERPMGRIVADANGLPFHAFKNLAEAKEDPEGVVILQGDYGGQIHAVAPAHLVKCSANVLAELLVELDRLVWKDSEPESRAVYYERISVGSPVPGGTGGAVVSDSIWVHPEFGRVIVERIKEVLSGERTSIR